MKGLGKLEKNPMTCSGFKPMTFQLAACAATNYVTACPLFPYIKKVKLSRNRPWRPIGL
jgi:hypothetical protein